MIKTKKLISGMFLTLCLVLSLVVLSTFNNNAAFAEEIENEGMELNLEFVGGGKLQASATAKQGYVYQYWIKTKLVTDESSNLANEQYIWQCLTDHDGSATKLIDVTANDVDQYGRYNVIVRIKEGSEIIDVIYRSYAKAGISEVRVNDETVNGEIIVSKNSVAKIQILSDSDVNQYSLYYSGNTDTDYFNETGNFMLPMNTFKTGYNLFRAEIETADGQKDIKEFKVYVYDEYIAEERAVIKSFTGETDWVNNGLTIFKMQVEYANGAPVFYEAAGNFNYTLVSQGIKASPNIISKEDGTFEIQFTVNYIGKHGIYYTVATVSRKELNVEDDKVIRFYDGYARSATLKQKAQDNLGNNLSSANYTASAEQSITITAAEGSISGASAALEYAFYREDASGWVLIKDYSTVNTLVWTPVRPGTYNIQARVRETGAGSYEKASNIVYKITNVNLAGQLDISIYDYQTDSEVTDFVAGRPYKIEASYSGSDELLYMFTLKTDNLGTVYLNKYSPTPYIIFIPSRVDNYIITARAISVDSYGYKDVTRSISISTGVSRIISFNANQGISIRNINADVTIDEDGLHYTGTTQNPLVRLHSDRVFVNFNSGDPINVTADIFLPLGGNVKLVYLNENGAETVATFESLGAVRGQWSTISFNTVVLTTSHGYGTSIHGDGSKNIMLFHIDGLNQETIINNIRIRDLTAPTFTGSKNIIREEGDVQQLTFEALGLSVTDNIDKDVSMEVYKVEFNSVEIAFAEYITIEEGIYKIYLKAEDKESNISYYVVTILCGIDPLPPEVNITNVEKTIEANAAIELSPASLGFSVVDNVTASPAISYSVKYNGATVIDVSSGSFTSANSGYYEVYILCGDEAGNTTEKYMLLIVNGTYISGYNNMASLTGTWVATNSGGISLYTDSNGNKSLKIVPNNYNVVVNIPALVYQSNLVTGDNISISFDIRIEGTFTKNEWRVVVESVDADTTVIGSSSIGDGQTQGHFTVNTKFAYDSGLNQYRVKGFRLTVNRSNSTDMVVYLDNIVINKL